MNYKIFNKIKIQHGSTLIELLLYIGLLAVFMTVLGGILGTAVDLRLESNATSSIDKEANYIFARTTYDIHRADSIDTPINPGDSNQNLVLTIQGVTYTYNLNSSGNLVYTNDQGSFYLNNYDTKIDSISFNKIGNLGGAADTVHINITLSSIFKDRKGTESRNFQTTVGLR